MNEYIERMNWAHDRRNCNDQTKPKILYLPDGTEQELPTCWGVCPVCNGEGKHVNPSIDCGGLTAEDFEEDPGFMEDYLSGQYDVTCNACGGRTTIRVVDESRMTEEEVKLWHKQLDEEEWDRQVARSEFIYGC